MTMQPNTPEPGVTTDTYAVAMTLNQAYGAVIAIKNTHESATMYYKVNIYLSNLSNALEIPFVAETDLAANTQTDPILITYPFHKAEILVKQHSGAGTYQADAIVY